MAYRSGLLPGLLERELLGCKRSYAPNHFTHAYTCQAKHAGVIRVDPDGEPCPPYSITYNKVVNGCRFLTVGDEEGSVSIVDTWAEQLPTSLYTDHNTPPKAKWLAHNNTIFDMAWAKNDSVLYTASGDQHVGVWDTTAGRLLVYCAGHDGSVKAVCPHSTQPDVFASGSRDGAILLWDLRSPSSWSAAKRRMQLAPVLRIDTATASGHFYGQTAPEAAAGPRGTPGSNKKTKSAGVTRRSVTSLLFVKNEHTMISSSDCDGVVKLWDLRSMSAPTGDIALPAAAGGGNASAGRRSAGRGGRSGGKAGVSTSDNDDVSWLGFSCPSRCSRTAGITSMALSLAGDMLLVSSIDSCHYLYRVSGLDQSPVDCLTGHRTNSFCIKACFSPDGSHVLSGSTDKRAYVWDVNCPADPPVSLPGHTGEVTAVAWCPADHCQIATAADDATLRVWTLDRGSERYERQYEQANVLFPARQQQQQGLWERSGFATNMVCMQPQQQQRGQELRAKPAQAKPAPSCSAATADGAVPAAPSVSPPTTPQLPCWNSSTATAAGEDGAPADSAWKAAAAPVARAAAGAETVCQTPAGVKCKGVCVGVSPSLPPPHPTSAARHSTPRLKQITIAQQLSAIKAKQLTPVTVEKSPASAAVQPAATSRQQQAPICSPAAPAGTPQAAPQQPSQQPCSSTSKTLPATAAAAVSPAVQDQQQAFADWMNTLTPSPASSPEPEEQQGLESAAVNSGLCLTQQQQRQRGCRASLRRGGVVELSTPWNLPTPVRQQRQQEQDALEAERLQQSMRLQGLSLQECDGSSPSSSRASGRGKSPGPAACGRGGGVSCCRLLQDEFEVYCDDDEDDAENRAPAAAPAVVEDPTAAAAAGRMTAGDSQGTAVTPRGLSFQENLWQQQQQLGLPLPAGLLDGAVAKAAAAVAATRGDFRGESPADIDMIPCSLPPDTVASSLPQHTSTQHTQQQQQQQQHELELERLLEQPAVQGVRSPRRLSQQQGASSPPLPAAEAAARIDVVLSLLGTKPGAVLLAAGARTPLGDLSPLLPAEPDLVSPRGGSVLKSPAAAAAMLAAGSGGAWGGGGSSSSTSGRGRSRTTKGLTAGLAGVPARNSPVRALKMSPPPETAVAAEPGIGGCRKFSRSPVGFAAAAKTAAGDGDEAGVAGSPIMAMLLHGRRNVEQQQQRGVSKLLTEPQKMSSLAAAAALGAGSGYGVQSVLLSPSCHASPGGRKYSRLSDKQVSPLPSAGKHLTPARSQQKQPLGSPAGVLDMLRGSAGASRPVEQQQQQRHSCHQEQLLQQEEQHSCDPIDETHGEEVHDHAHAAAAAAPQQVPQQPQQPQQQQKQAPANKGRERGGIKRSHVFGSSNRKKQCTLAALWTAKEPEVEDGASRFSGF